MNMGTTTAIERPRFIVGTKFFSYTLLILLSAFCVFPFYILLVNSTRMHAEIIKGFSAIPGSSFLQNLSGLLGDQNIPVVRALINSVFISTCCAVLTTYFSSMTA